jgi:hypothetical protein
VRRSPFMTPVAFTFAGLDPVFVGRSPGAMAGGGLDRDAKESQVQKQGTKWLIKWQGGFTI